jgi:phosphatidylinositol-3-phosphatase
VTRKWLLTARGALACALLLLAVSGGPPAVARGGAPGTTKVAPAADLSLTRGRHHRHRFVRAHRLVIGGRHRLLAVLRFRLEAPVAPGARVVLRLYPSRSSRRGFVVRRAGHARGGRRARLRLSRARVRSGRLQRRRWVSIDVTGLLKPSRTVRLALTTRSRRALAVASREARAKHPRLVVRAAPAPAAAPAAPPPPAAAPSAPVVAATSATPCGVAPSPRPWQHVVWIVMENKQYGQIGAASAPYINSLVTRCGLATSFFAEAHPSLPNYIAMTSGSVQGISDDSGPSSHPLNVPNIFAQLGTDWRSLAESMPTNCLRSDAGLYAVRHVPATYYTNIAGQCATQTVPLTDPPNLSAKFTFITPNECNDMHSCPTGKDAASQIRNGDTWLAQWMPKILDGPEYRSGNTAVFLTWDEDDYSGSNQVVTVVISPSTPAGLKVGTRYDHYSLLRTTQEMLGLPTNLGAAATAPSMRGDFRL